MRSSTKAGRRERREFTVEFKAEAVRLVAERRAAGATLTQAGRELDVRPDQLRTWAPLQRDATNRSGAAPGETLEQENRRLRREVATLRQEQAVAKNHLARAAPPVAPETRSDYCLRPERRGRSLIGVVRARRKTWSGGGARTCKW